MESQKEISKELSSACYDKAFEYLDKMGVETFSTESIKEEYFEKTRKASWEFLTNEGSPHLEPTWVLTSPKKKKEFTLMTSPLSSNLWKRRFTGESPVIKLSSTKEIEMRMDPDILSSLSTRSIGTKFLSETPEK